MKDQTYSQDIHMMLEKVNFVVPVCLKDVERF